MNRALRLMHLIELLRQRYYSTRELADRCGVHQRTIQRDLLDLQGEPLRIPLHKVDDRWKI